MLFSYAFIYDLKNQDYTCFIGQVDRSFVLGRNSEISGKKSKVSREHLEVIKRGDRLFIKDLASRNGTSLNGRRLEPNKEYEVQVNDLICLPEQILLVSDNPRFDPKKVRPEGFGTKVDVNTWVLLARLLFSGKCIEKYSVIDDSYAVYGRDSVMDELMGLLVNNNYQKLAESCEAMLAQYPDDHELLNLHHLALLKIEGKANKEKAIECLIRAIELAPEIKGYQENLKSIS